MKSSKQNKNNKLKKYQNGAFKKPAPFGNYTTPDQPQGTITTQDASFAPGVFSNEKAENTYTPFLSPLNIYDVNLNNSQLDLGPLTQGQYDERGIQNGQSEEEETETSKRAVDPYSLLTLGMGLTSMGLNRNQELQNRQDLYSSIQDRQSQPQYDYNYMYGRTTSGGTEYQPIVKAQMGAQINKRYNTPNSINNVEIEGGEYLQLPDMSTEMAYGPSHSNGGIQTSLPDGTKVFSNHMKPMGSKKTFAQIAKKYDNTKYDDILNNKFSKQVDKDTAMIMKQKNQKVLDKLFMDQQLMNGNSNGEPMAKYGASINNPGFKALPKAVQNKIISNMMYGGYSLPKLQDGDWYTESQWDAAMNSANSENLDQDALIRSMGYTPSREVNWNTPEPENQSSENWYTENQWDKAMAEFNASAPVNPAPSLTPQYGPANYVQPTGQPQLPVSDDNWYTESQWDAAMAGQPGFNQPSQGAAMSNYGSPNQTNKSIPTYTEEEIERIRKYDPNFNPILASVPGMQRTVDGVYGSKKNIDIFKENYDWYLPKFKEQYGRDFDPTSKKDVGLAQKAFHEEAVKRFIDLGYTPEEAQIEANNIGFTTEKGLPNSFDDMLGFYTATRKLPNVKPKDKSAEADKAKEEEKKTEEKGTPKGSDYSTQIKNPRIGKFTRAAFPLEQAIPGIMGLANAQETFPYAIPEVDSPYIRPQTLNIQSQLQDIDNMGQAAVRAGADPLSSYIAGLGQKDKSFQTKQNFDAQARMQADAFNAQAKQQAEMFNAQNFDRVYNNMIAQARDAQTAEQQAAINSIIKNKAMYDRDQTMMQYLHPIYAPTFDFDARTGQTRVVPNQPGFVANNMTEQNLIALAEQMKKDRAAKLKEQQAQKSSKKKTK